MTIRGPLGAPRAPAARFWVPLAASAFLAYFFLLLFCDFRRPSLGAVLALDDGVVLGGVNPGSAADAAGLRSALAAVLLPVTAGYVLAGLTLLVCGYRTLPGDKDLLHAIADSLALVLDARAEGEEAGPMMECPECGRCESPRARRCPADASTLTVSRSPRRVGQRYFLERRLARGGMGTVYEAVDTQLGRRVAVKVLRDELVESAAAVSRFGHEARLIAALNHPNIVVVHDFGVAGGGAYLVMECLEGMTLRARLTTAGRLPAGDVRPLLRGMASALEAAHARGIVHRDVKPENVFIVKQGSAQIPKILDFGIARLLSDMPATQVRNRTRAGEFFGTPDYMAPEQSAGEKPSIAWDVWALAVVAHEMITGCLPDEDPGSDLPPPLGEFFARALSVDPAERPSSAVQFVEGFEEALTGAPGAARTL